MTERVSIKPELLDNRRKNNDRIVLNVGGTKISTSKVTLSSSSLYFSRQFSDEWNDYGGVDDEEEFFLDQDPDDFKVLLSFMRLGKIEAKKLTPCVLIQANFLAMELLLQAVRVTAKRMAFYGDQTLLKAALKAGIIDKNEAYIEKEFASLVIFHPIKVFLTNQQGGYAEKSLAVAEVRGTKENLPNEKITFIDGLNLLSRLGYNKFENEASKDESIMGPNVISHLHFSRQVEDEGANDLADLILLDDPHHDCIGEKEFALQIDHSKGSGIKQLIEAAFEEEHLLNVNFRESTFNDEVCTIRTKTSRRVCYQVGEAMNWLHSEGYERRESHLASSFLSDIPENYRKIISSLHIWSRMARTGST